MSGSMKYEEHFELALRELEEHRVPNVQFSPLRQVRARDPEVRKKLIERRKVQRRARRWMPPGYLWLLWRGKEVRPPQYCSAGQNFKIYLSTSWRTMLDPVFLGVVLLFCIGDLDEVIPAALRMLAMLAGIIVIGAAIAPLHYQWIRKKYALSSWEQLANPSS
jgi:hypothetical protein